jgi:hypothetical protein
MAVWPSWPQACIFPGVGAQAVAEIIRLGHRQASMSARKPITARNCPCPRMTPTTPCAARCRSPPRPAEGFELLRDDAGGAVHLEADLRMRVDVAAPGGEVVVEVGDAVEIGTGGSGRGIMERQACA